MKILKPVPKNPNYRAEKANWKLSLYIANTRFEQNSFMRSTAHPLSLRCIVSINLTFVESGRFHSRKHLRKNVKRYNDVVITSTTVIAHSYVRQSHLRREHVKNDSKKMTDLNAICRFLFVNEKVDDEQLYLAKFYHQFYIIIYERVFIRTYLRTTYGLFNIEVIVLKSKMTIIHFYFPKITLQYL